MASSCERAAALNSGKAGSARLAAIFSFWPLCTKKPLTLTGFKQLNFSVLFSSTQIFVHHQVVAHIDRDICR